jgi:hypothetical protein
VGNSRPEASATSPLQHARPRQAALSLSPSSTPPPAPDLNLRAASSLGQLAEVFWLAGHTSLGLHPGAIPVLAEPELLLPFCDVVDWRLFSVRVPPERWREIPEILRAITPGRLREMQAHLAAARDAYFENPMRTAVSLVWFRLQALGGHAQGEGRPSASASSEGGELQLAGAAAELQSA